jgi:hypothetical protein
MRAHSSLRVAAIALMLGAVAPAGMNPTRAESAPTPTTSVTSRHFLPGERKAYRMKKRKQRYDGGRSPEQQLLTYQRAAYKRWRRGIRNLVHAANGGWGSTAEERARTRLAELVAAADELRAKGAAKLERAG